MQFIKPLSFHPVFLIVVEDDQHYILTPDSCVNITMVFYEAVQVNEYFLHELFFRIVLS